MTSIWYTDASAVFLTNLSEPFPEQKQENEKFDARISCLWYSFLKENAHLPILLEKYITDDEFGPTPVSTSKLLLMKVMTLQIQNYIATSTYHTKCIWKISINLYFITFFWTIFALFQALFFIPCYFWLMILKVLAELHMTVIFSINSIKQVNFSKFSIISYMIYKDHFLNHFRTF